MKTRDSKIMRIAHFMIVFCLFSLPAEAKYGGGWAFDSYWDIESSGLTESALGEGRTTLQMKDIKTFLNLAAEPAIWTIDDSNDYPRLVWEQRQGEMISIDVFSRFLQGRGTQSEPYLISDANELELVGGLYQEEIHFKLVSDIDLSGRSYTQAIIQCFSGVFDGAGFTISNLTVDTEGAYNDYLGLFGRIDETGEVKGLDMENVIIIGENSCNAGGLAGLNSGTITSSHITGVMTFGFSAVGGLVGFNSSGKIDNCYSDGDVTGKTCVGGLVGCNASGIITDSSSAGSVSASENEDGSFGRWYYGTGGLVGVNSGEITGCDSDSGVSGNEIVGGLVGSNYNGAIADCSAMGDVSGVRRVGGLVGRNSEVITNCYSTGNVTGGEKAGGLVGQNGILFDENSADIGYFGVITNCYTTGSVIGTEGVGGLVGYNEYGTSIASLWDIQTSGQTISDGGTGKTTAEMQNIDTFLNSGWDFVDERLNGTCDYWQISPVDYPRLHYRDGYDPVMPEGLGTAEQPYLIRDARDLGSVWFKPSAHYRLEASVDLSEITWSMAVIPWFEGIFDGNGFIISNLDIQGGRYLGLFGKLFPGAKISNLGLEGVNINGIGDDIGGLVGENRSGSITISYSTGTVEGTGNNVGGFVGENHDGDITMSYSMGTVSGGGDNVGGLVGRNRAGNITMSYSTGTVNGIGNNVGGLVGLNDQYWIFSVASTMGTISRTINYTSDRVVDWNRAGKITTSYSSSSVEGNGNVGGLVGENRYGDITMSYSTGIVSGIGDNVGGLVGYNKPEGNINASYSTGTVSGNDSYIGGLVGLNNGSIITSYSMGTVSGYHYVGGLVGWNRFGSINTCYSIGALNGETRVGGLVGSGSEFNVTLSFWDTQTSGRTFSAGGAGKTTSEMQMTSTFLDAGWDFIDETANGTEDIWWIDEGQDYPRFWWELLND